MNYFILFSFLLFTSFTFSQNAHYNSNNEHIAEGYDVVSYFTKKKPVKGLEKYGTTFENAKFLFSSKENQTLFKADPKKYIPQYGGYCAYAIAAKNTKMDIDAETYEVRDGKLYLFYNAWFSNKLEDWQEEDTPKLQKKGDANWEEIKKK